jgi:ribosome-associated toxin RatA of RatAB toxin-antitoxin module
MAQSDWNLKKDQNGILIYSRSLKDSKFNELKAVFDLPGTFDQLSSILNDVSNYKTWVYGTASSNLIERKSSTEIVYYSQISVPWPASNRDFYSDTRIWVDSATHQMHLSSRNIDSFPHSKAHFVRIPFLKSDWLITATSTTSLHIDYILSWDPGGNIPAFIANTFSTSGPLQSFTLLKRKMALMNQPVAANR